jgi:hypothetical protein
MLMSRCSPPQLQRPSAGVRWWAATAVPLPVVVGGRPQIRRHLPILRSGHHGGMFEVFGLIVSRTTDAI